jgi:hypothetical protein
MMFTFLVKICLATSDREHFGDFDCESAEFSHPIRVLDEIPSGDNTLSSQEIASNESPGIVPGPNRQSNQIFIPSLHPRDAGFDQESIRRHCVRHGLRYVAGSTVLFGFLVGMSFVISLASASAGEYFLFVSMGLYGIFWMAFMLLTDTTM